MYSMMFGSSPCIIVQSPEIIKDLLEKRGSNYSSRADYYVGSELASQGLRFISMVSVLNFLEF